MHRHIGLAPWLLLAISMTAFAGPRDVYVPPELEPWRGWVLEGREYVACPFLFNKTPAAEDFVCAWPGRLELVVDASDGRFAQSWTVFAGDNWLALPGNQEYWPQEVRVDGRPAVVVAHDGTPSLRLGPGTYRVTGRFEWAARPRTLRVPATTGLVSLTVQGRAIDRPQRNGSRLWLGEREQQKQVEDALKFQVYRLVADNVPIRLSTRLRLVVSGSVREELFGPALPAGFAPIALQSELPARLEPDGLLRVQVRPGSWEIQLTARAQEFTNSVGLSEAQTNWPDEEIWSYLPDESLRVTVAEGLDSIDPSQAQVPAEWQRLPAYRIEPGQALQINERSRGKVAADNQLTLARQLWLDFSGEGFTFIDDISGAMRTDWRLDMAAPYQLLSAQEGADNLLVTRGAAEGLNGVELRRSAVDVSALGRTDTRGTLPVTGWQTRFNRIDTQLNLPPGEKLLAALGADQSPGSWVSRWRLLDFFLVLIITIAAVRLFGRPLGALALFAVALSFHEPGAPVWTWLHLLAAVALVRVAPAGRFLQLLKAYRAISLAALVLLLVPFIAQQLQIAIYPQLETAPALYFRSGPPATVEEIQRRERDMPALEMAEPARMEKLAEMPSQRADVVTEFSRYAPNAIVTAGPGRPGWQWNSYRLTWSGPVDPERTLRLLVLPRWAVTVLRFVMVALLLGLAAVFVREVFRWGRPASPATRAGPGETVAAALVLGLALGWSPGPANAETPPATVLNELQARLLAPPDCAPRCAEILAATVEASGDSLSIRLQVDALETVAVPLPGSLDGWRPRRLAIDGAAGLEVFRDAAQVLWSRVPAGGHVVTLSGPLPAVESLEIPFPAAPRVISVSADGWFVAGVEDRRLLSGSLQLTRLQQQVTAEDAPVRWESTRFPSFVEVRRTLLLDLDWRVLTEVDRVAPAQGAVTLNIPLLDGESVISEDITVTDNRALVSMNPTQTRVSWVSTLSRRSQLTLTAPAAEPWQEIWNFRVGSVWNARFSGVPESETGGQYAEVRDVAFFPRPGESVTLEVLRPEASAGSTLAFDGVQVNTNIGERSRNSSMSLQYRSTRGAQHVVRLPPGAEVMSVSIDGRVEPLAAENGELTLPILPGEHDVDIAWRNERQVAAAESTPAVDLGAAASNITAVIELPRNRWILATTGPRLGPAVMYWPELAALILFAVILGRFTQTPLSTAQWVLLGLGFSTFSWPVLGLVAAWLLVVAWRGRWRAEIDASLFNLVQVAVAALTVAALIAIVINLPRGLLGTPDMHVTGNNSMGNTLRWFADRSEAVLPTGTVYSAPLWIYKVLILAWALWLSFALVRWLPWAWRCFNHVDLWRPVKPLRRKQADTE